MTCAKCGKPNPTDSVWCDYCRDEEAGFPAHMRTRAIQAALISERRVLDMEAMRRKSWRLRGHR